MGNRSSNASQPPASPVLEDEVSISVTNVGGESTSIAVKLGSATLELKKRYEELCGVGIGQQDMFVAGAETALDDIKSLREQGVEAEGLIFVVCAGTDDEVLAEMAKDGVLALPNDGAYDQEFLASEYSTWPGVSTTGRMNSGSLKVVRLLLQQTCAPGRSLPESMGSMGMLTLLDMSGNGLVGHVPDLSACIALSVLNLSGNAFDDDMGEMGAWLAQCLILCELYLGDNKFSGALPAALGQLKHLKYCRLSGNTDLVGDVPNAVKRLAVGCEDLLASEARAEADAQAARELKGYWDDDSQKWVQKAREPFPLHASGESEDGGNLRVFDTTNTQITQTLTQRGKFYKWEG
jgi:hypothetical protein